MESAQVREGMNRVVELDRAEVAPARDVVGGLGLHRFGATILEPRDKLGHAQNPIVVRVERVQQLLDELRRTDEIEAADAGHEVVEVEVLHASPVELVKGLPQTGRAAFG